MGIKKHDLRYLIGCQNGCQKTLINKGLFLDTLAGESVRDVSRALAFARRPDTQCTDKRKLISKKRRWIKMDIQKNIITINEFNGKFRINESYRPIAAALIKKYPELKHIAVESILFVEDTESTKKNKGQIVFAQISAIPEKWSDIVYQASGQPFDYLLEVFKINTAMMSREQVIALIYHELRHIGTDGSLKGHDIEDWTNMVEKLGTDWNVTQGYIPDLLAEGIDWESIEGPANLFPSETTLRVVK